MINIRFFVVIFSIKSRQYLDLFIQRVKDSFTLKETETSNDPTRKNEMKNIQETIKQLHGNIYIFSRSIEQLIAENETNLGKIFFLNYFYSRNFI